MPPLAQTRTGPATASFDRIARVYRVLEYASFGHALERTREHFIPQLATARCALVLGDGDGRFVAKLLVGNPELRVVAVDSSERMLVLLQTRCQFAGDRLTTHKADLSRAPGDLLSAQARGCFDLVVTHFLLDCLSEAEASELVRAVGTHLRPEARWLVSEFRVPSHGLLRPVARFLVRSLYLAFRLLTGLRVSRLPDYAAILALEGFSLEQRQLRLGGLLVSDLWKQNTMAARHFATAPAARQR